MRFRFSVLLVFACLTIAPRASTGQTTDPTITFTMPLNLTNISPDISKVAILCRIQSAAILTANNELGTQVEFVVRNGQVYNLSLQLVTAVTVNVHATNLDNPVGKPATYVCSLTGFSTSANRWDFFDANHMVPAFRLSPTPTRLTGSFVW